MGDVMHRPPAVRFSQDDADRAHDEWGANCGPGAIAAILGLTLDELRPHMGDFEDKRYTNPTLMLQVLRNVGANWRLKKGMVEHAWPRYGLARVQWEGPWIGPGIPIAARYRHTHWVGAMSIDDATHIFDVNAMQVGGWIDRTIWAERLVPWLLSETVPRATGGWHLTHVIEIERTMR